MSEPTEEEMRVAIAAYCGWTVSENGWWSHPTLPDRGGAMPEPPSYFHDLNDCHAMEEALTGNQPEDYWDELAKMVPETKGMFPIAHATARQRATAFYKTICAKGKP